MVSLVTPHDIRARLLAGRELALLDLREEEPYARGHPLFAAQMAFGRIECEILDRVPRKDVPIVVYDDGEGLVEPACAVLEALGYSDVAMLDGGLAAWSAAGFEMFEDVNSYAKAFGELVEARRHTPSLSAGEVQQLIDRGSDMVILDARRFDEYATMNIPTSSSVPGAELVLQAPSIARDANTTVIVNCAGRTRSIIGAQSLVNAGIPNRVFALRNGTIGWTLAGQALERGSDRRPGPVDEDAQALARTRAREVAYRAGVRFVEMDELDDLAGETARTIYRFDVRPAEEYATGHIPAFRNAPGGQLVQEIDMFAPVRNARIILCDNRGVRAYMTASWLAQMGWEVLVLDAWPNDGLTKGASAPTLPAKPQVTALTASELATGLSAGGTVLFDLGLSSQYNAGHIPGAVFVLPMALEARIAAERAHGARCVVLTSPDGILAVFAAGRLAHVNDLAVLDGGTAAWVAAGHALAPIADDEVPASGDRYRRPYEGTDNAVAAMQAYLDWEFGLVAQLERDGTHGFFVI